MNTRQAIVYGSIGVAAVSTVWLLVNRNKKKKQIEAIMQEISTGANETGQNIDTLKSQAFNPTYYKTVPQGTALFKDADITAIAKSIKNNLTGWNKPDKVVLAFKRMTNQAQVSQLADKFNKLYNLDLAKYLDDELNDPNPIAGYSLAPNDLKAFNTIMSIVKTLPKK